jgi:glutamate racemase
MIGVLGSEIGDLTVLSALAEKIPDYDLVYFGDTARAPYGSKSPKTVIDYTLENIEFLKKQGAKVIVLACNTVASVAADRVRERFDIPVFEGISPSVKLAIKTSRYQRFGVIGTRSTIISGTYEKKIFDINPEAKVFSSACPLLSFLIEESWFKKPEAKMIVKKYLHPLKVRQIDTLILGCSCYTVLAKIIQAKIGKQVHMIDSSIAMANGLKDFLKKHPEIDNLLNKNGKSRYLVSDLTQHVEKIAQSILKGNIHLEAVSV